MNASATAIFQFLRSRGTCQANRLLARTCLACGISGQGVVCDDCYGKLNKPVCRCQLCGIALPAKTLLVRCKDCTKRSPPFEALDYLASYEGVLADWIVSAKIGRQAVAIEAIQTLVRRHFATIDDDKYSGYTLLPMPIPKYRLMQRGFNLPRLMAKQIAKTHQLAILPSDVVLLPRYAKKQAKLSKKQREKHVRKLTLHGLLPQKILIIDDVVTTGSTMRNLCSTLNKNGAQSLSVWTLARSQL